MALGKQTTAATGCLVSSLMWHMADVQRWQASGGGVRLVKMLPVHSTMDQPLEALSVSGQLLHGVWAAPSS